MHCHAFTLAIDRLKWYFLVMKGREERLKALRKLIRDHSVAGQDELLTLLNRDGFEVTQATLSRDLKALRVGKVSAPDGSYVYALPEESDRSRDELIRDFQRGYLSMEANGSLVVLKTLPGHAQATAWAMDNLEISSIMGTVAGDDTILIILRSGQDFTQLKFELEGLIPGWEI